jgi:VanZ family protein
VLIRLKYWLPAICVAILISLFSTHYFSSQQTARVIIPVLRWFLPFASFRTLNRMHTLIRKLAHVTEFGVFSTSVFYGVRGKRSGWQLNWAVYTLLIAVTYAGLDEWHQTFVPLREARVRDVLIDSIGALLAQIFVWVVPQLSHFGRGTPRHYGVAVVNSLAPLRGLQPWLGLNTRSRCRSRRLR